MSRQRLDVEMGPAAQATWDALVEEHFAVQQLMVEAMADEGEASAAAYDRLAQAFANAAELLMHNTRAEETP